MLDIADREFQTLNDEYEQKKQQQENDLEIYIRNLLESPERDYIVESLKELVLWIDSPKFREELLKKQSELMAKKIDVDKFIEDSMSEIRSDGKYKN